MIKVPSYIKDAVATLRGWANKKGELLKAQKLTQEQVDEFNGLNTQEQPQEAPPEVKEVEAPKVKKAPATRKKTTTRKKAPAKPKA